MKNDSIKKTALLGLIYLGAGKWLGKLFSFATTLVLARLLSPEDYGTMALVMVFIGFLGFFNEIGLGSAILQRPVISAAQLDGCFYLSLMIGSALCGVTFFLAPFVAHYYENLLLTPIIRFVALTFIFGSLATVSGALINRAMNFKMLAGIEFVAVLLQSIVTLVLAWLGFGVWALVWGFFASQVLKSVLTYHFGKWHPSRVGGLRAAVDLIKFGATVTYSRITWYFYNNAKTLIIGKTLNSQLLGIYSMADTLASLPNAHITSLIISVASPLFARLQHDLDRLNRALLRLTSGLALINYPVMVGMVITAPEFVPLILGSNWVEVVLPLQILCLVGLVKSIDPLITQALISTGRANIAARYTSLCALTIPGSVFVASIQWGLQGAAVGTAVAYSLSSLYLFFVARRHLHLSMRKYVGAIRMAVEACVWMLVIVLGVNELLIRSGINQALVLLVAKTVFGAISYAVFLIYVRKDGLRDCYEVLCEVGISKSKLNRWPFSRISTRS